MKDSVLENIVTNSQLCCLSDLLSKSKYFLNDLDIFHIEINDNYIKWSSSSFEYPCQTESYYLFAPFKLVLHRSQSYNAACLLASKEIGESNYILDSFKSYLAQLLTKIISPLQPMP